MVVIDLDASDSEADADFHAHLSPSRQEAFKFAPETQEYQVKQEQVDATQTSVSVQSNDDSAGVDMESLASWAREKEQAFEEGLQDNDKKLMQAAKGDDFSMQGALGARFKRSDAYKEYRGLEAGLPGINALRKKMRAKWAQIEWDRVKTEKYKVVRHSEIDIEHGRWLPIPRVLKEEGGRHSPEAVRATEKYLENCKKLGVGWVRTKSMTDGVEVFYITKEFRTEHQESRVLKDSDGGAANPDAETEAVVEPQRKKAKGMQVAAQSQGTEEGRDGARQEPSGKPAPVGPSPNKHKKGNVDRKNEEKIRNAMTLKAQWSKAMQEAATVGDFIANCKGQGKWGMVSLKATNRLTDAVSQVKATVAGNTFASAFLTCDAKQLKVLKGDKAFVAQCENIIMTLKSDIGSVDQWLGVLRNQYDAIPDFPDSEIE